MAITGSCHCGAVSYTLQGDAPSSAVACNCSICRRRGYLLHFAPAAKLTEHGDAGAATSYFFNQHRIDHRFCRTCGCAPYGTGTAPNGTATVAINLRCADGIDLAALNVHHHDGASA